MRKITIPGDTKRLNSLSTDLQKNTYEALIAKGVRNGDVLDFVTTIKTKDQAEVLLANALEDPFTVFRVLNADKINSSFNREASISRLSDSRLPEKIKRPLLASMKRYHENPTLKARAFQMVENDKIEWRDKELFLSIDIEEVGNTLTLNIDRININFEKYALGEEVREVSLNFSKILTAISMAAQRRQDLNPSLRYLKINAIGIRNEAVIPMLIKRGFAPYEDLWKTGVHLQLSSPL